MAKKEKDVKIKAINLDDLPQNVKLSEEDLKKIWGGVEAFNSVMTGTAMAAKKEKQAIMIGYKGTF